MLMLRLGSIKSMKCTKFEYSFLAFPNQLHSYVVGVTGLQRLVLRDQSGKTLAD